MPVGAQAFQFAVEVDADTATHADDHRLAVQGVEALLEVPDNVLGDQLQPPLRADEGLQLCPLGLDLLLALYFLALGQFLELRVNKRTFIFV